LGQGQHPDTQDLAAQELDGAHGRQEDLYDPAGLLLHDANEDPCAVLREHEKQQDEPDHRGHFRRSLRACLEGLYRDRLGAGDLGRLGRCQPGRSESRQYPEVLRDVLDESRVRGRALCGRWLVDQDPVAVDDGEVDLGRTKAGLGCG
jgi:hypothetical protein